MKLAQRLLGCSALLAILAGCGGGGGSGGGDPTPPAADCSVAAQKAWLGSYMNDWYFWYRLSPSPDASGYASVEDYFNALLFAGDATFPRDRFSYFEPTASFNQFYGEGKTLGYGVFVAGVEVTGRPDLPLYVRYIEPLSDAGVKGVRRSDQVLSVNGRNAADIIAANDFSALTPRNAGDTLTLVLRGVDGSVRSVALTAQAYTLSPVSQSAVVTSPAGRRLGYIVVKDMISQSAGGIDNAFAQFRAQGVQDLVLDLRYNGGGLVSVAGNLSSHVTNASGRTFAALLYNDKRAFASNETFRFGAPAAGLNLPRVFVLTGSRTCSASEQVINGLRGAGVQVVAIGGATCGKPVGFLPASQCGTTYSVVNFESVNARTEGRYFDGFAPTCAVADDATQPLGSTQEALLGAAASYADRGVCPTGAAGREQAAGWRARTPSGTEPGERQGMIAR